jgi:predicted GNAT family acetyltransferase
LSVAGVHVYSEPYRVAALGNVATHTAHRGQGLATTAVAALCRNLLGTVDHVGLNVAADNTAAIRCYQRLGFRIIATYEECYVESQAR